MSNLIRSHPANAHPELRAWEDSKNYYRPNRGGSFTVVPKDSKTTK